MACLRVKVMATDIATDVVVIVAMAIAMAIAVVMAMAVAMAIATKVAQEQKKAPAEVLAVTEQDACRAGSKDKPQKHSILL